MLGWGQSLQRGGLLLYSARAQLAYRGTRQVSTGSVSARVATEVNSGVKTTPSLPLRVLTVLSIVAGSGYFIRVTNEVKPICAEVI